MQNIHPGSMCSPYDAATTVYKLQARIERRTFLETSYVTLCLIL